MLGRTTPDLRAAFAADPGFKLTDAEIEAVSVQEGQQVANRTVLVTMKA